MFIDGIIIGLIVALLRRGKLSNITKIKLAYSWLIIIAFAIQYGAIFLFSDQLMWATPISYLVLIFFCFVNRRNVGFYFLLSGLALNPIVMVANKGRMPVALEAAKDLDPVLYPSLVAGEYGKHIGMSETTNLNFLGDIFYLQSPYPHPTIVSMGDLLFSVGAFLFIQAAMVKKVSNIKKDVVYE